MEGLKNWRVERDDNRVAWLRLDMAGTDVNVLSRDVLEELGALLADIAKEPPAGLIIASDKPGGFIAGADIKEFAAIKERDQALELVRRGQSIFDTLEALPFPTVAMIHGFCLGGGMELALACRYRVADDGPSTRLGLPEVLLGIHPGFGGTVRLPLLVGALPAMDMILTGRNLDARKARKIGLIDFTAPARHLKARALKCVLESPPRAKPSLLNRLSNASPIRTVLKKVLRRQVRARAKPAHYPVPYAVIDLWAGHIHDPKEMLVREAESIAGLLITPTARNLARVFSLRERLKSLGKETEFRPKRVHVVGAGIMGGDIAAWCALMGMQVTLQDRGPEYIAPALKRAGSLFKKRLKTAISVRDAMDRLLPDVGGANGVGQADVIIEAIFEDVEAKRNLFIDLESRARPDAILATNTSSIPLEEIGKPLKEPGRLVGIHFFNPVAKMPLVEVVSGPLTDKEAVAKALAFVGRIDRLPLPVKSSPGFLVNRVLMPYIFEAMLLAHEGVSPMAIDKAALNFGMPMGPLLLADTVGLDVCLHVARVMENGLKAGIPNNLKKLVESGRLGKKSGRGFYEYKKGKQVVPKGGTFAATRDDLIDRLTLPMFNESAACLRQGVVENEDLLDAGSIFGTGFAPFRGGPMHYCGGMGKGHLRKRLTELEKAYGERFHPDPWWAV